MLKACAGLFYCLTAGEESSSCSRAAEHNRSGGLVLPPGTCEKHVPGFSVGKIRDREKGLLLIKEVVATVPSEETIKTLVGLYSADLYYAILHLRWS